MKRKATRRRGDKKSKTAAAMVKGSLAGTLSVHLPLQPTSSGLSRFQKHLETEDDLNPSSLDIDDNREEDGEEGKDFILSQDLFCTPDYITPQQISVDFEFDKENSGCPKSPEKSSNGRKKRFKQDPCAVEPLRANTYSNEQTVELKMDSFCLDDPCASMNSFPGLQKKQKFVSQSAVALRCRVMSPPCIKNPYSNCTASLYLEPLSDRKPKSAGFAPPVLGGDGLSRYHTDFHEIEQIGCGNFSRVFKVLKRIDGCMYAVKHSIKQLRQETERRRALMEIQALAALGSHENIVGYHTSWFENEQLYIQMELCDCSLSINTYRAPSREEILQALQQIAKALQYMHERGVAHLDVKPENIYVKNGVYKLGDFGCATLINGALPIEEGDSRYMPQEILNDNYDQLDKVDIFSLGAAIYELVKGSPLPDSGPQFSNLREGKISLLPGCSLQFQCLLKVMMDPDPVRRPSAKEIRENPIFDRSRKSMRAK